MKNSESNQIPQSHNIDLQKLLGEFHRLQVRVEELEAEKRGLQASRWWRVFSPFRNAKFWPGSLVSLIIRRTHRLGFRSVVGLAKDKDKDVYFINGPCPHFLCKSSCGWFPTRWVDVYLNSQESSTPKQYVLYVDAGEGFKEEEAVSLDFRHTDCVRIRLSELVRNLRLDPVTSISPIAQPGLVLQERYAFLVYWNYFWSLVQERGNNLKAVLLCLKRIIAAFIEGGGLLVRRELLKEHLPASDKRAVYSLWVKRNDLFNDKKRRILEKKNQEFSLKPLISVIMPVYDPPPHWLGKAIESVKAQVYDNWELCIADDASTRPGVKQLLEGYAKSDCRIRVTYRDVNGHISASSNTALSMAKGEFVALFDHDDELSPEALFYVVEVINKKPTLDLIYSDEDRVSLLGIREEPYFKPEWNLDLFLSQNLISHLGIYRTKIAKDIGGFRLGYEGSQDWDFALRFIEQTDSSKIVHIPKVLYHWRRAPQTFSFNTETKVDAVEAGKKAVNDFLSRNKIETYLKKSGMV